MSEQSKIEGVLAECFFHDFPEEDDWEVHDPRHMSEGGCEKCVPAVIVSRTAWQARSLPLGVPDGWALVPVEPTPEILQVIDLLCDDHRAFDDSEAFWKYLLDSAPAAPTVKESLSVAPTVKAEQLDDDQAYDRNAERLTAEALGTGPGINMAATSIDELFDQTAPSLPPAGSAGEEVEVVGYRFFHVDHGYIFRRTHIYEGNPSLEAHSLMTVAQRERIDGQRLAEIAQLRAQVTVLDLKLRATPGGTSYKALAAERDQLQDALSAQQSAPERVNVPVEFEPDRSCEDPDGCPTELAVLKRYWREHKAQELSGPIREAIKWADHLLFECGALTHTRAPSVHVYNKTFAAVEVAKALLASHGRGEA